MSSKVNIEELVTVTQAAESKGVTRQWIDSLLRRGKIEAVQVAGKRFVRLQDVLSYVPQTSTSNTLKTGVQQRRSRKQE
jgi:excisionase family DNA binding protein